MLLRPSRLAVSARTKARVEIIPLIDVVFFLLATFVLFTLSLNRIGALPLNLPFTGKTEDRPEVVTILVTEGAAYWNDEPVGLAELPARLTHYKAQAAAPRVVVTGDTRAKFGPMVTVLDEVRRAGITQFSVETKARPAGR